MLLGPLSVEALPFKQRVPARWVEVNNLVAGLQIGFLLLDAGKLDLGSAQKRPFNDGPIIAYRCPKLITELPRFLYASLPQLPERFLKFGHIGNHIVHA